VTRARSPHQVAVTIAGAADLTDVVFGHQAREHTARGGRAAVLLSFLTRVDRPPPPARDRSHYASMALPASRAWTSAGIFMTVTARPGCDAPAPRRAAPRRAWSYHDNFLERARAWQAPICSARARLSTKPRAHGV
jgi:hypothetical protein